MKDNLTSPALFAFASGLMGILGYGFLVGYLVSRSDSGDTWILMNRLHDIACAFQFLFLIPVISGAYSILRPNSLYSKKMTFFIGIVAAFMTSVCLGIVGIGLLLTGVFPLAFAFLLKTSN